MSRKNNTLELRDVHSPGHQEGEDVHWQMASGHDAIDISISTEALTAIEDSEEHLDVFERHREFLCDVARSKAVRRTRSNEPIRIERHDLAKVA